MKCRKFVYTLACCLFVTVIQIQRTEAAPGARGLFDDLQAIFGQEKPAVDGEDASDEGDDVNEQPDAAQSQDTQATDENRTSCCDNEFSACGVPNRGTRVVGGRPSRINEYPWAVALTYRGRFYCGGSLINDRYVLTAAHCINGLNHNRVEVTLGEHDRHLPFEAITVKIKVLWWLRHPDFNPRTFNNDIAIIRMKHPVTFSRIMRPVCLPKPGYNYTGEKVTVVGWGRTSEGGPTADLLQEIKLPVFSNAECRSLKYSPEEITTNMLCAGYSQGKIDACQGDSGGPMLWQAKDGKTDIIGIVSWGQGCGRPGLPGVYTRVSNYLDWIEDNTPDACYCGRRTPRRRRRHLEGDSVSSAASLLETWRTDSLDIRNSNGTVSAPARRADATISAPARRADATVSAPARRADATISAPARRADATVSAPARRNDAAFSAPARRADAIVSAPERRADATISAPARRNDAAFNAPARRTDGAISAVSRWNERTQSFGPRSRSSAELHSESRERHQSISGAEVPSGGYWSDVVS